jgi:ferredoxin
MPVDTEIQATHLPPLKAPHGTELTCKAWSQEAAMLSFAAVAQPDSRLSCQLTMSEDLDGILLRMPEGQH